MNTIALQMARRLFIIDGVPSHTQRHNIRSWVRSIRFLGKHWLIAKPQERK
jgi:hypothetical protein